MKINNKGLTFTEYLPIDLKNLTDCLLNDRKNLIKKKLLDFTLKQHDNLMKRSKIQFNPVKSGTWHSSFDLDCVKMIRKQMLSLGQTIKKRW